VFTVISGAAIESRRYEEMHIANGTVIRQLISGYMWAYSKVGVKFHNMHSHCDLLGCENLIRRRGMNVDLYKPEIRLKINKSSKLLRAYIFPKYFPTMQFIKDI
jgi:hypothetical protein